MLIEQPELHIHPKLQCDLGDLFISTANDKSNMSIHSQMIIETHSEHLLLRLLKRIRETSENNLEPGIIGLKHDDIAIYYSDKNIDDASIPQEINIKHLRVDKTGEFIDQWPKGFFEERDRELFNF